MKKIQATPMIKKNNRKFTNVILKNLSQVMLWISMITVNCNTASPSKMGKLMEPLRSIPKMVDYS